MNPILDAEQITRNMRECHTGWKATIAQKHHPYAVSEYGHLVHKVIGVRINWAAPTVIRDTLAVYECGESSVYPHFYKRRPPLARDPYRALCSRCFGYQT